VLCGRWHNCIVLNVHSPIEGKSDEVKDCFYEELEQVFHQFLKHRKKYYLQAKIRQESLHQDSNNNGFGLVNFATSQNLVVKSAMFPHRNIHKYTWTSPDGKTHNQIEHVLIDRRWHSFVLELGNFRGADCDTDHYVVIAKFRERLAMGKQVAQRFDSKDLT